MPKYLTPNVEKSSNILVNTNKNFKFTEHCKNKLHILVQKFGIDDSSEIMPNWTPLSLQPHPILADLQVLFYKELFSIFWTARNFIT